jgi:L-seryl-tRNA(Ser) seleniumtransferase
VTLVRRIPKVDKVLDLEMVKALLECHPRPVVMEAVRTTLDGLRQAALDGSLAETELEPAKISGRVIARLTARNARSLRRVVNGTGVVIHTNLGRSPLPEAVREALNEVAFGYSNLEFDLETGERGMRYSHVEELICELTGAEAALVVNNNAAAVLLALSSLAAGSEVIVSRGELVEIGGSFRIPDVMRQGGAILKEVGTTNRTHPKDYREAINPQTGLLLKVHTSNFAVVGFTREVTAEEMVAIGREHNLPVMADVGSGSFIDVLGIGEREPTVQEFVKAGVDVITFSGDKMMGGPQAGIIIGTKAAVQPMKKHPLLRAVRIDKMTLAALEGTLRLYRDERQALAEIPTLRMLAAKPDELAATGRRLLRRLRKQLPENVTMELVSGFSQTGGGALPTLDLPTTLIAVSVEEVSPQELERHLRGHEIPVIGRIHKGRFLLDVRTLNDDDVPMIVQALTAVKG